MGLIVRHLASPVLETEPGTKVLGLYRKRSGRFRFRYAREFRGRSVFDRAT